MLDRPRKCGLGVERERKMQWERGKKKRCVAASSPFGSFHSFSLFDFRLLASVAPHAPTNRRRLRPRASGSKHGGSHGSGWRSSGRSSGGLLDGEEGGGSSGRSGGGGSAGKEDILLVRLRPPREGLGHAQGLVVVLGGLYRRPEDGTGQDHDAGPRKGGENKGEKTREKASKQKHGESRKKEQTNLDDDEPRRALSLTHRHTLFSFLPPPPNSNPPHT